MKIVVEGYDSTGKSTLVDILAKKLHLAKNTAGGPPPSSTIALIDSQYQLYSDNIVWDRITPISRMAYEPLNKNNIEEWREYKLIIAEMIRQKTIFIWSNHVFDIHILKEHDTKEHIKYITDNKKIILKRYEEIFSIIPHHLVYNAAACTPEYILCQIKMCS